MGETGLVWRVCMSIKRVFPGVWTWVEVSVRFSSPRVCVCPRRSRGAVKGLGDEAWRESVCPRGRMRFG